MKKTDISRLYRELLRKELNNKNISRLKNHDFTIISQNCVGGVILHELKQKFNTPTINLFFSAEDFIKLISKLDYYLSLELCQIQSSYQYPVGLLGDLTVHFMHYTTFEEAKRKWEDRTKRIKWDNIYIMMVQGADCSEQIIKQFDDLPFEKKVIFTAKEYTEYKSAVHIKDTGLSNGSVMDLCQYKSKLTGKRWIDDWDYVGFLNS